MRLRFAQTVSSEDAHVNDQVQFEVLEEVRVADVVVIPKGGIAWDTVTEAQPKRRMARGGKLEIVMDSVRLADGEKAAVRATKEAKGGGHTGAMTAGIVATGLILWPAAPFFLFMHGKEVTIPKGTEVPTFVNGNFPLELAKFEQTAPSMPLGQVKAVAASTPTGVAAGVQPNATAELDIASSPAGADIQIDNSFVGNTPSVIGVAAGDHTIAISKNGYKPRERRIKVSSGKVDVAAELEASSQPERSPQMAAQTVPTTPAKPIPAVVNAEAAQPAQSVSAVAARNAAEPVASISFQSNPVGADINIDNAPMGKTPMTLKLTPGLHTVRMFMSGYDNWMRLLTFNPGMELNVTATLTKSK